MHPWLRLLRPRFRTGWWSDPKEMHAWLANYQFGLRLTAGLVLAIHAIDLAVTRDSVHDGAVLRLIHDEKDAEDAAV